MHADSVARVVNHDTPEQKAAEVVKHSAYQTRQKCVPRQNHAKVARDCDQTCTPQTLACSMAPTLWALYPRIAASLFC